MKERRTKTECERRLAEMQRAWYGQWRLARIRRYRIVSLMGRLRIATCVAIAAVLTTAFLIVCMVFGGR